MRSALDALTHRDDGRLEDPTTPEAWSAWVSAGRTRNVLAADPLLDWLELCGRDHGFTTDHELPGYDERTALVPFLFEQGRAFEDGVVGLIARDLEIVRICAEPADTQRLEAAAATVEAMERGVPVIAQAVLRNSETRTYGVADLLVRSDVIDRIVPGTLAPGETAIPAPNLGDRPFHYVVVEIKFTTLKLRQGRTADAWDHAKYMVQAWIYNEALGRIQGYVPPAAFLLGRTWQEGFARGVGCFERLARVEREAIGDPWTKAPLSVVAGTAVEWVRRVRAEGAAWQVLPEPSVPELYPNLKNDRDFPWHAAKQRIGAELADLTIVRAVNPARRAAAFAKGIRRWDDPRATAAALEVPEKFARDADAILATNREPGPVVRPERIPDLPGLAEDWRRPRPLEFFVDFETVSPIGDDFSRLPARSGQNLIFQVGCGWTEDGRWVFDQWTTDRLMVESEGDMLDAWIARMDGVRRARGLDWTDVRLYHWWAHETSTFDTAWDSARSRHGRDRWPELPWFDLLTELVQAVPVTVRGAFRFGLKPMAKAMHAAGLIETVWDDGPTDGMGAMIGAFRADAEAAATGGSMRDTDLMRGIAAYNEVDCRTMAEILAWLRANR